MACVFLSKYSVFRALLPTGFKPTSGFGSVTSTVPSLEPVERRQDRALSKPVGIGPRAPAVALLAMADRQLPTSVRAFAQPGSRLAKPTFEPCEISGLGSAGEEEPEPAT